MKYFIGFIVGFVVTSLGAWLLSERMMMDGSIESSFTSLVAYSAIENGLADGNVEEVQNLVSGLSAYEKTYIIENQDYALRPKTIEIVREVLAESDESD